jgi:hypothetical protein
MAWRNVKKDGAIQIYGSLFYRRGDSTLPFPPGHRVWVEDGFDDNQIQVFAKRYDGFLGYGECAHVFDKKYGIYVPETRAQTRLRQSREHLMESVKEVEEAAAKVQTALAEEDESDAVAAQEYDRREAAGQLTPDEQTIVTVEDAFAQIAAQKGSAVELGQVIVIATFIAMQKSADGPKHPLRTEMYTFGYPVYADDLSFQETADSLIDDITASWDSPSIRHTPRAEMEMFGKIGEDWSWDDATAAAPEAAPQPASGEDT